MPASPPRRYCLRCERDVAVEYENSAAKRRWWRIYFLVPVALLPVSPILASDFAVCLPLVMAYLVGLGQVLAIVREVPTCADCGALILPREPDSPAGR